MSEPLVLHRVVGRQGWLQALRVGGSILAGMLLCGACVGATLTQDLDKNEQVEAAVLGAVGAVVAFWGFERVARVRLLLFRGPVLRLDEHGVWVRTGSVEDRTAAAVAWSAVASAEVAPAQLPPQFRAGSSRAQDVVRFVLEDEAAVEHDPLPAYSIIKAAALGLSPVAATMTFIVGADTYDRIALVRNWLAANRPDLPIHDARS